jgi:DNA-binding protein H-NS
LTTDVHALLAQKMTLERKIALAQQLELEQQAKKEQEALSIKKVEIDEFKTTLQNTMTKYGLTEEQVLKVPLNTIKTTNNVKATNSSLQSMRDFYSKM